MTADADLQGLELRLGRRFHNRGLLAQALVHRSHLNETRRADVESNERLEFLGDAVIGYVVASELYRRFTSLPEGKLTELRAHLVRWETLADVARRLRLGEHLVLGKGEEQTGGRTRAMNLARAFEAVVGAVAEDGTMGDVQQFILRMLAPELQALEATTDVTDVKSRLQAAVQSRLSLTPEYQTIGIDGPDHARIYHVQVRIGETVAGEGWGRNKRTAERAAATEALGRWEDDRR